MCSILKLALNKEIMKILLASLKMMLGGSKYSSIQHMRNAF